MTTHVSTYFDHELNCEVKVYAPQEPKKRNRKTYVPMKERDAKRLENHMRQAMCMNAYDAATNFGMQREEAVERVETTSDFEAALRRERAKYNRRKA